jgi:hypothetical protein
MTYALNDFIMAANGTLSAADVSGSLPTVSQMTIGDQNGGGNELFGAISQFRYFASRLSNAQLVALTV